MTALSNENRIIDLPDLNKFQIGDAVICDATYDHDRHEGIVIGIELQRVHGSRSLVLKPSITLLHDVDQITDGFLPEHLRKVVAPQRLPSEDEKREQGKRCSCGGSDDYCPCQNVLQNSPPTPRAL